MCDNTTLSPLQQWAPIFKLHPEEENFPCSVPWYLQNTRLLDGMGNEIANPVATGATLADTVLGQRVGWTLDILDESTRDGQQDSLATAPVYAYVRPVLDNTGAQIAQDLDCCW